MKCLQCSIKTPIIHMPKVCCVFLIGKLTHGVLNVARFHQNCVVGPKLTKIKP